MWDNRDKFRPVYDVIATSSSITLSMGNVLLCGLERDISMPDFFLRADPSAKIHVLCTRIWVLYKNKYVATLFYTMTVYYIVLYEHMVTSLK
jgi:hypothetical protein